jgi:hypothetical protein
MNIATRMTMIVALLFAAAGTLFAQEETTTTAAARTATTETAAPAAETTTEAAAEPASRSSYEVRSRFTTLLRQSAPELVRILALEPSLLSNDAFLAGYPELARFVAANPEIRQHPRFYMAEFEVPTARRESLLEDFVEGLMAFLITGFIAFALAWFVRTVIEQKRWSRLSRTQSEVHNKILDRFGTTAELLEYIRTPAGTKFLESAPIPLHADPLHADRPARNLPMSRVLLSIQAGIVITAGAVGMLLVSGKFDPETNQSLSAMGVIGFCVGVGFVGSALVSLVLSRRLGVWEPPPAPPDALDDAGPVR